MRVALVGPAGCFLVGCALSYAVTLRYQWHQPNFTTDAYLAPYYYQGKFDALAIFEFAIAGGWRLFTYHLSEVVAIAAISALALLLVATFRGKFQGKLSDRAIAVLFALCLAISVAAALLGVYPLGEIRQVIYLGPLVFLAAGVAFYGAAGCLAGLTRRGWLAPTLAGVAAGVIVLAGGDAIGRNLDWLYASQDKGREILTVLKERAQEEDVIYVDYLMQAGMEFHQKTPIGQNVVYGAASCRNSPDLCFQEIIAATSPPAGSGKLWLILEGGWRAPYQPDLIALQALAGHVSVEHIVSGGSPNLYRIEDTKSLIEVAAATDMLKNIKPFLPDKPPIRSTFDIYLREDMMLLYVKKPCRAADVPGTFFLHVEPEDPGDLPSYRRWYSFDNLDFNFQDYSLPLDEGCVALRVLPDYPIRSISTGQYTAAGVVWEVEFPFNGAE